MEFLKFPGFYKLTKCQSHFSKCQTALLLTSPHACQALISDTSPGTEVIIETPAVRAGRSLERMFRSSYFFSSFRSPATTKILKTAQKTDRDCYKFLSRDITGHMINRYLPLPLMSHVSVWCLSAGQTVSWRRAPIPPRCPSDPVPLGSDRRSYYFSIAPVPPPPPPSPQGDAPPPRY